MARHLWKKYPEGSRIGRRKRWLAFLLGLSLIGTMLPIPARAEEEGTGAGTGLCRHHTEHTADCGYAEAVEGQACEHTHDDGCGYQEASDCTHVHTEECGENGETCTHVHDDACGYAEDHACGHIHDESCGYVESAEGSPCTFVCDICGEETETEKEEPEEDGGSLSEAALAVQALIDALPAAEDITEENLEAVSGMLDEIDTAREALTDEEREVVDFTKYDAAAAKMMELMGQAGAGDVAVMSLSGIDFRLTGKPADATVRSINLNAAVLRPESTWSSGGNLVYFGIYDDNPVAYRVLSSPNTQESSGDYLLLDCDTILKKMMFSARSIFWTDNECTVMNWLKGAEFYDGSVFSGIEKTAIAEIPLAKQDPYGAGDAGNTYKDFDGKSRVFCLSAAEADGLYADDNARNKTDGRAFWWLRSFKQDSVWDIGVVNEVGKIGCYTGYTDSIGVSPALNVNLSSVLFASENGTGKASALAAVSGSTAEQWKLTLRDSNKTVKVTDGQSVTRTDAGGSTAITVPYTYTDTNTANPVSQISVMITDKAYTDSGAQVLYYGALDTTITGSGASGTGTFTLPADLAGQTCGTDYYAYIVAEDVNGSNVTDYAGDPAEITIPAASASDPVTPDIPAAAVKGRGFGISIIADPTAPTATNDAWKGSYVYFGAYEGKPVKYRVLDRSTTDFGGTTMLLDCDSVLWTGTNSDNQSSRFDDSSNVWADSEIKTYLNGTFLSGNFTDLERAAIAASSKANAGTTDGNGYKFFNYVALSGEQIFLLDAKEATNTSYGYGNTISIAANRIKTDTWWLRSAFSDDEDEYAGIVCEDGGLGISKMYNDGIGVSPALNVKLSSVIFTSVLSGTSGQPGAEYKLTLSDKDMTITPGTLTRNAGGDVVTVPYTIGGTNGGNATQVSLMVLDKEYTAGNTNGAKLVAYEKLADAGDGSGSFTLPADLTGKTCGTDYFAYIIAEDVNGEKETDYAGTPVQITIPATASKYTVTVTNGTLDGGNTTGDYAQGETVTITAGAAPKGQQFKEWKVVSGSITLANSTSETTTFTMPAEAVSVQAVYKKSGNPGGGSGNPGGGSGNPGGDSGNPGGDSGNPGGDSGNPGGDSGNPGGDSGSPGSGSAAAASAISAATSARGGSHSDSELTDGRGRKDDVPRTGEDTHGVWLSVLTLASGAGLLLTGRKGRRMRKAVLRQDRC